jgi:tRNA-uridine 2-sulfurtransferase
MVKGEIKKGEIMRRRCIALLSGGLDSKLAIRLMQVQGIWVEALNFKTVFTCCQGQSAQAARELGVPLTVVAQEDDYLDLVRKPRFGYGKGANPCVDCRIYMFERAKRFMEQVEADFIVSGEVLGQRPKSQKRRDLRVISHHSRLDDLLLRPLSARRLPKTLPEREGWVDRRQLYDFHGRSRKKLIALAQQLGIRDIPVPSTGCALTEPQFSKKVFDLIHVEPATATRWDYELLKFGRHFRYDERTKMIVGRHFDENGTLEYFHQLPEARSQATVKPENFKGPLVLIVGEVTEQTVDYAGTLAWRFSRQPSPEEATIRLMHGDTHQIIPVTFVEEATHASTLATM